MTATDELRRMLYERGESWHKWPDEDSTTWQAYSDPHTATESMDGTLIVTGLTPAQAIAATLGPGTCHNESEYPQMFFICSECGCAHKRNRAYVDMPRYCPNCGAKVVEVDE